ncbi:MAG: type II secretion system protein [Armatimonadota bacterium]
MRDRIHSSAFTMVEMLTVIAIIAVLAAIIFPVAATVREQARRTTTMSNLHQIQVALKMYKQDNRVYPEALLGYVAFDGSNPIPADRTSSIYLYQAYIRDINLFRSPNNPVQDRTSWRAVEVLLPDPNNPSRRVNEINGALVTRPYYLMDSMDIGPTCPGSGVYEQHYSLYRPYLPTDNTAGPLDDMCQLQYNLPPESTIVTWVSDHRSCDSSGQPAPGSKDIVLLLSGTAKPVDSRIIKQKMTGNDPNFSNAGQNKLWCLD